MYRVQLCVSEILGHYQQGYNDLTSVILDLLLDQLIVKSDVQLPRPNWVEESGRSNVCIAQPLTGTTLDEFMQRGAQVCHLFLQRMQPVLQMFTVETSRAQRQRQSLSQ